MDAGAPPGASRSGRPLAGSGAAGEGGPGAPLPPGEPRFFGKVPGNLAHGPASGPRGGRCARRAGKPECGEAFRRLPPGTWLLNLPAAPPRAGLCLPPLSAWLPAAPAGPACCPPGLGLGPRPRPCPSRGLWEPRRPGGGVAGPPAVSSVRPARWGLGPFSAWPFGPRRLAGQLVKPSMGFHRLEDRFSLAPGRRPGPGGQMLASGKPRVSGRGRLRASSAQRRAQRTLGQGL